MKSIARQYDPDMCHVFDMQWSHFASRNIPYNFFWIQLEGYINLYPKFISDRLRSVLIDIKGENLVMWRDENDMARLRKALARRVQRPQTTRRMFRKVQKGFARYKRIGQRLLRTTLNGTTDADLVSLYEAYIHEQQFSGAALSTHIEVTNSFAAALAKQFRIDNEVHLSVLSTPIRHTTAIREEATLLRLLLTRRGKRALEKHFLSYRWLPCYFNDPAWTLRSFQARVARLRKSGPRDELRRMRALHRNTESRIQVLARGYRIPANRVRLLRSLMYYRMEFENLFGYVTYASEGLRKRFAKKLRLPVRDLQYLRPEEIVEGVQNSLEHRSFLKRRIEERRKHVAIIAGKERRHEFRMRRADRILKHIPKAPVKSIRSASSRITGVSAHPGVVRGKARIITRVEDVQKVRNGEVLVCYNTTPTFVPSMKRSIAVVTDEGGITCHAAIVSREMGIPCIVGTKIATTSLKTGERIEVDATKGIVKKL